MIAFAFKQRTEAHKRLYGASGAARVKQNAEHAVMYAVLTERSETKGENDEPSRIYI